jgi:hypothetical protein
VNWTRLLTGCAAKLKPLPGEITGENVTSQAIFEVAYRYGAAPSVTVHAP